MAEAFLRDLTGDEFEIVSAGDEAGRLDPHAVAAMQEVGIDISLARTKVVDPYLRERFHHVISFVIERRSGRVRFSQAPSGGRHGRSKVRLHSKREASTTLRLCAMPAPKSGHIVEFVEEQHHPRSSKGKSVWK